MITAYKMGMHTSFFITHCAWRKYDHLCWIPNDLASNCQAEPNKQKWKCFFLQKDTFKSIPEGKQTKQNTNRPRTHTEQHMKTVWMPGGGLEVRFCAVTVDANEQKKENRRGTCPWPTSQFTLKGNHWNICRKNETTKTQRWLLWTNGQTQMEEDVVLEGQCSRYLLTKVDGNPNTLFVSS